MLLATTNFLVPNATFVVELLAFLLVLAFLAKRVLPPINKALETRQEAIARNIKDAEEANKRAHDLEEQQHQALEEARQEARALRDAATKVGEQLKVELQKKGEEEYQRLVARAGADIEASTRKAAEELRGQVAELVLAVVERVLVEGITLADQQQLVDRAIAEVEAQVSTGQLGAMGALAGPPSGAGTGL
jgi:F-type H+-transporting ATPase subunit b